MLRCLTPHFTWSCEKQRICFGRPKAAKVRKNDGIVGFSFGHQFAKPPHSTAVAGSARIQITAAAFPVLPLEQKTYMSSGTSDKSFTQQWLQSLTAAAREPVAQQVKPLLENINELTRLHSEGDRLQSARRLWDFASSEGLLPLLEIMPLTRPNWVFDRDDNFSYTRRQMTAGTSSPDKPSIDFDTWTRWLGIERCEVPLIAEVNNRDWTSLLRQEAVRLQQTLSTTAIPAGLTLHLDCTAIWDKQRWSVRFDQAQWMILNYEDPFSTDRPDVSEIEPTLWWVIAQAAESLLPKSLAKCDGHGQPGPWIQCVPSLTAMHERILVGEARDYPAWFRRVWACIWTVIYREQNVLKGQANIDVIRSEVAIAIKEVPRLTLWMFCFAKLVCECQLAEAWESPATTSPNRLDRSLFCHLWDR